LEGAAYSWEGIVLLIICYVAFMIAGDLADYLIGLIVEREFGRRPHFEGARGAGGNTMNVDARFRAS
jgi:hypothetical protein